MISRRQKNIGRSCQNLTERYGAWALVAGASEGLGAAYAHALARRGMDLVLVARRKSLLDQLAGELRSNCGVKVRCLDGDLATPEFLGSLEAECSGLDLGLIIYNATHAPIGEFASAASEDLAQVIDVNVRAQVELLRRLLPGMLNRGRGGVILMTSLAGNQGAPRLAAYAASKAFTRILAESLWYELKEKGIDVVGCCAGAVRTPGYEVVAGKDASGTLDPEEVVEAALRGLGRGPIVVPGSINRAANVLMNRLLPRRAAIRIMGCSTDGLSSARSETG